MKKLLSIVLLLIMVAVTVVDFVCGKESTLSIRSMPWKS